MTDEGDLKRISGIGVDGEGVRKIASHFFLSSVTPLGSTSLSDSSLTAALAYVEGLTPAAQVAARDVRNARA
ncbi:protein of unknown function [Nitrospira japonica]|uniref:Uncharacterized protein n=1 Tax=Nitrospira japonica TaxID=1325564 RepID=A0A1W1I3Z0_9BACT|nr:protein of unknown function [Nitrospira japonica]